MTMTILHKPRKIVRNPHRDPEVQQQIGYANVLLDRHAVLLKELAGLERQLRAGDRDRR